MPYVCPASAEILHSIIVSLSHCFRCRSSINHIKPSSTIPIHHLQQRLLGIPRGAPRLTHQAWTHRSWLFSDVTLRLPARSQHSGERYPRGQVFRGRYPAYGPKRQHPIQGIAKAAARPEIPNRNPSIKTLVLECSSFSPSWLIVWTRDAHTSKHYLRWYPRTRIIRSSPKPYALRLPFFPLRLVVLAPS